MVGDNLVTDILGAKAAGIDQIWFNPSGKPTGGAEVTHMVRTLAEVRDILMQDAHLPVRHT